MAKFQSAAIVPDQLYVRRDADEQLRQIISEMGRPGYVLVARQMGKTNLLLNMKREREIEGDIVLYVDLSNRFDSARGLFRSIIDSLCEVDDCIMSKAWPKIADQRIGDTLEPNIEYDRHLRLVLKSVPQKKIIVILDEVDSLITVPYSDSIFAQIRSMYFSRTNHKDYLRLTYVLSGVAEPTDLIKDKNISPFNIGQKIYLDDFSVAEVRNLVGRAGIPFSSIVVDRVYYWTSGNPRMTWDVFSELEKTGLSISTLSSNDVDQVVNKLYLIRFDQAPIDSIRALVESDPQIRSAIISLRWNKSESLSARIRDRLYLAGITSAISADDAKLKNRIIDAALSDSWLELIVKNNLNLLESASESFNLKQFRKSITLIEEYRSALPNGSDLSYSANFQAGMAYYYLGLYEDSLPYLLRALDQSSAEEHVAAINFYLGSVHLNLDDISEARNYFGKSAKFNGLLKSAAQLGLASAQLSRGNHEAALEAQDIVKELIKDLLDKGKYKQLVHDEVELLTASYASLYRVGRIIGDRQLAESGLADAFRVAPKHLKPAIIVLDFDRAPFSESKNELVLEAASIVLNEKLKFSDNYSAYLSFDERYLALIVNRLIQQNSVTIAGHLLEYATKSLYGQNKSTLSAVVSLLHAIEDLHTGSYSHLAWYAVDNLFDDETSLQLRLHVLRFLRRHSNSTRLPEAVRFLIGALERGLTTDFTFEAEDLEFLFDNISSLTEQKRFKEVVDLARLGVRICSRVGTPSEEYRIIFRFQEFLALQNQGNLEMLKILGHSIISDIDASVKVRSDVGLEGAGTVTLIRQRVLDALNAPVVTQNKIATLPANVKLGRNDRVTVRNTETGESWTTKHKRVENDLRSGRFVLMSYVRGGRK